MAFGIVSLTELTALVSTASIEVSERNVSELISICRPFHHLFHRQLGLTIRVGGAGSVRFEDRNILGLSVGCCRRGEDDLIYVIINHCLEKHLSSVQIVFVILERICNAFTYERKRCKVNDRVDFFLFEKIVEKFFVCVEQLKNNVFLNYN